MASKKGPREFTHWRRPRCRMYDYNYEYASSYYKPQVQYIGEAVDPVTRKARRRTMSPPGAKTFSERWAANPFYGRYEPISEYEFARSMTRGKSARGSSIPVEAEYAAEYGTTRGRSVSRARSVSREQSVYRGQSVATTIRARSVTRARSVSRAASVYEGDYEDARTVRARSGSYYDDGYYYDPLSEQEWERISKSARPEEREKSIFQLRMSLENPRELPSKKMMQTTVGHGMYQSSLYGTFLWDPTPYLDGRQ